MKNKLLVGLVISLFLMSFLVTATGLPVPVSGQISLAGYSVLEGLTIEHKNLRTSVVYEQKLDAKGYYVFTWNGKFLQGDKVTTTIKICEDMPSCSTTFTLDGNPKQVNINVPSNFEVVKETSVVYRCYDGTEVSSIDECGIPDQKVIIEKEIIQNIVKDIKEVLKIKETIKYVCLDGSEVESKDDCDEASGGWLVKILGSLCALFAAAGGWKFYRGVLTHYHRGLRGYHNANTEHRNKKYRHARFWKSPMKCLKDVRKIQQGIDLRKE